MDDGGELMDEVAVKRFVSRADGGARVEQATEVNAAAVMMAKAHAESQKIVVDWNGHRASGASGRLEDVDNLATQAWNRFTGKAAWQV